MGVGINAHQRLQKRRCDLERRRDHADLAEIKVVGRFENGIDGGHDRLHHVVEKMAETDRREDAKRRGSGVGCKTGKGYAGHEYFIVSRNGGSFGYTTVYSNLPNYINKACSARGSAVISITSFVARVVIHVLRFSRVGVSSNSGVAV